MRAATLLVALVSVVTTACAGGQAAIRPEPTGQAATGQDDSRTLVIASRSEPQVLVSEELNPNHTGNSPDAGWQLFHAELTQYDDKGAHHLQIAEAFPQLGTDTWKVFPDGRMETTWHLRPNLTWHDGAALSADDFVFSIDFQKAAGRNSLTKGTNQIDGASAPDPNTLVVRYNSPFADAGEVAWEPLPRHLLGQLWEQIGPTDAFDGLPYWTTEFVGLGPYRVERWEPAAFITGVAFPAYVNGKPKIARIQMTWISDPNAAVANLLSGNIGLATDLSVTFEQVPVLRQEWAARGETGAILLSPARTVYVQLQFKPDYVNPAAMLDLRFRQALAQAIDKRAIVDVVLDGEPGMADTLVSGDDYPELDSLLTKYPLDPRRSAQLLSEMGLAKDGDGFFSQGGARVSPSLTPLGNYQREALVLADGWKRAGVETPLHTLSVAEQLNPAFSQTFPAMAIIQFGIKPNPFAYFTTTPTGAGPNAGGFSDPEFDRLAGLYASSLDRKERDQAVIQGMKLLSGLAAYFPLYYGYEVIAHDGGLVGPLPARQKYAMWKAEDWHWK